MKQLKEMTQRHQDGDSKPEERMLSTDSWGPKKISKGEASYDLKRKEPGASFHLNFSKKDPGKGRGRERTKARSGTSKEGGGEGECGDEPVRWR